MIRKHRLGFVVSVVALAFAFPLVAGGVPTTHPGPHAAQISGAPGKVTHGVFAVRFAEIDGRRMDPRDVIWLEPGRYELRVLVDIPPDQPFGRRPGESLRWQRADADSRRQALTIEIEVEAGKTYQIRARHNRDEGRGIPFTTVLWRIDE
ncbi:MAG: hypothetical protein ACXIUM_12970 [Wenzhouxiangella sp.]